nr:MAG TPA: hypothetical protein [Caudoviricetes sp.]
MKHLLLHGLFVKLYLDYVYIVSYIVRIVNIF